MAASVEAPMQQRRAVWARKNRVMGSSDLCGLTPILSRLDSRGHSQPSAERFRVGFHWASALALSTPQHSVANTSCRDPEVFGYVYGVFSPTVKTFIIISIYYKLETHIRMDSGKMIGM